MQNRTPVAPSHRAPVPDFEAVPRKYRHDGWTPERQRAFIEALADTGSVTRAAGMVNMAQRNCYALRRAAGAESFAQAWDAALDFGIARLRDIAFERATEGVLVPRFHKKKLLGYDRKYNDALLMFLLRHYAAGGEPRGAAVRRVIAVADAGGSHVVARAEVHMTDVRATGARAAGEVLSRFAGVAIDGEAAAAIERVLADCAARARVDEDRCGAGARAAVLLDDPGETFVPCGTGAPLHAGTFEDGLGNDDEPAALTRGEPRWQDHGADKPAWRIEMEAREAAGLPGFATVDEVARLPVPADAGTAAVKRPRRRRVARSDAPAAPS